MSESYEWIQQGATLSDVTAQKEYHITREFIIQGIRSGKLEYRNGAIHGNPYLRLLRSQLEEYISEQHGQDYVMNMNTQTELRKLNREISATKKKLDALLARRAELEKSSNGKK